MSLASTRLQVGLHEKNRKLTRPRQKVLEIITRADRHLTPAEIYRHANAESPQIGLTTVYRTLDLLVDLGYIQRVHFADGCHSYAAIARPHGHHLVCSRCGRAVEFEDCDLEPLMKTLRAKTGYTIDLHVLELMGRCPNCQGETRRPKRTASKGTPSKKSRE
jgi:Fur family ferric uptake transcriptional regulator